MSAQQPRVMGHRRLPFLQRVLIHGAVACVLAAAGYNFIVRPERSRLSSALASLTSQEHDLQETQDLPHVVDDIPAAIIQMSQRRDQLLARLKDSGDASTLYAKIGKIAQRCGVRTDRIDPIRADSRTVASASLLDASNGIVLETYGYQIEVIGSYENIAKFTDAINTETGVSLIGALLIEPVDQVAGQPKLVRGTVSTIHLKLPIPKAKTTGLPASAGGGTN